MKEKLRTRSRVVGKVVIPDPKDKVRQLLKEMDDLARTPSRHYDAQQENVLEALFAAHDVLKELVKE